MTISSASRLLVLALCATIGLSGCGLMGAAAGAATKAVASTIDVFVEAPSDEANENAITLAETPGTTG